MRGSDGKSFYWTNSLIELMPHQTEAQVQVDGGGVVFYGMTTAEGPNYGSTFTDGTVNLEVYAEILESSLLDTMEYYGIDKKSLDSSKITQDNILLVPLRNSSDITDSLCKLFLISPPKALILTPLNMSGMS
ncbi:Phosphatidyl-N-methylethanolamine N-methyltransferase [Mucor velutinosus]|uniref:Phosphatidyl-N-methylethanolamine N-methyltransferase n=1 Tax=Mucor velutinosus TaxID=708070 RepID=A0AAN7HYW5_9FUNG|nr:Phosphatidyl-N-methylethanolamine N-methyltransferase [Mucor velutinosus]